MALFLASVSQSVRAADKMLSDTAALVTLSKTGRTPGIDAIIVAADKALKNNPVSVMDKTGVAAGGGKHDYFSLAPYSWPDPKSPGGPYVSQDGKVNPEYYSSAYDLAAWTSMCGRVECLARAWALTKDARYAKQAVRFVRVWFLDSATRMNPSLDYAQLTPGKRPVGGVIDTRAMPNLVDSLCLLEDSPDFTAKDKSELKLWMNNFLIWLTTAPLGIQEGNRANNRGTSYDTQVAALALYVGKPEIARKSLARAAQRLRQQIAADGSQPQELRRTKSLHYSVANLEAFIICARLGEGAGLNLWSDESLHRAVAYLVPYSAPTRSWPHAELNPAKAKAELAWLLAFVSNAWNRPDLMLLAKQAGWDEQGAALRLALFMR